MINVRFSVEFDDINRSVGRMEEASNFGQLALAEMMINISDSIISVMQIYPPETQANWFGPRGGAPSYVRTGATRAGWRKEPSMVGDKGYQVRIYNEEEGAIYVHHRTYQTKINIGRGWPILDDVTYRVLREFISGGKLNDIANAMRAEIFSGEFNLDKINAIAEMETSGDYGLSGGLGTPFG